MTLLLRSFLSTKSRWTLLTMSVQRPKIFNEGTVFLLINLTVLPYQLHPTLPKETGGLPRPTARTSSGLLAALFKNVYLNLNLPSVVV